MLNELRLNLIQAQQHMKDMAYRRRRDEEFKEGKMVYLKLQPYRQKSLAKRPLEKWVAQFYGPFEVTKRIGKVAYQLKLPPESKVQSVFHVSQLKRAIRNNMILFNLPTQLTHDLEMSLNLEELKDVRTTLRSGEKVIEVLIKWVGLSDFEATWEEAYLGGGYLVSGVFSRFSP